MRGTQTYLLNKIYMLTHHLKDMWPAKYASLIIKIESYNINMLKLNSLRGIKKINKTPLSHLLKKTKHCTTTLTLIIIYLIIHGPKKHYFCPHLFKNLICFTHTSLLAIFFKMTKRTAPMAFWIFTIFKFMATSPTTETKISYLFPTHLKFT